MKDSKQSPSEKTQDRIAKDKRELNRLIKEAQKHLVEGHSPAIYDYIGGQLVYLEDPIKASTKTIDNSNNASAFDMATYFTCAEKDILNSVNIWSQEYQQILRDAELRAFGYLYEQNDKASEYFQCAYYDADNGFNKMADDTKDKAKRDEDIIIITFDDDADKVKDAEEAAEQNSPGFWGSTWDAFIGFPAFMVNIQKMLDGLVNIDPEKYIEDNVQMLKVQQRLQKRLSEEAE